MTNPEEKSRELKQKEEELKKREQAIRLKELEQEIYKQDPPLYYPKPDKPKPNKLERWRRKAINVAKFTAFVVAGVAAINLASWMVGLAIVGGLGWFGYKLFLESKEKEE